ncbi:MAG: glycosyltransferase family 39 protein, partial [Candidatus Roizmanbacteria bacterium]|nr:glycosyltransferase family 39 protein [Candidatus Roizmanbacteria bacterium]
ARAMREYGFLDIIVRFSPLDFHPPLYYLLMKVWTAVVGYGEIALRFPSLLFALFTGGVVYGIARELKLKHPLYAASLFLFQPLIVYYSQEARMYLMAVFLLSVMYYYSLKKNSVGMALAAGFSMATFYGSVFAIAALWLWHLGKREYRPVIALSTGTLIALVLLFPLLSVQLQNAQTQLGDVGAWRSVLGTVTVKNLLLIPLKFAVGRISFEPKLWYWAVSGLWTALVAGVLVMQAKRNNQLAFLLVVPILLGVLASFITPLLSYFRFLYIAVPLSLLLAYSSKRGYILAGCIIWSLIYILFPVFHREDWKSLSSALSPTETVYGIPSSLDALRYYQDSVHITDIRTARSSTMTVVPYTFPLYGITPGQLGYTITKTRSYRGVSIEYWQKKVENE